MDSHDLKVTLIRWPYSQVCFGCLHGTSVLDDANYLCYLETHPDLDGFCEQVSLNENLGVKPALLSI